MNNMMTSSNGTFFGLLVITSPRQQHAVAITVNLVIYMAVNPALYVYTYKYIHIKLYYLSCRLKSILVSYRLCVIIKIVFGVVIWQCLNTHFAFKCNRRYVASWWRHALLSICVGNSPVTGELPAQRPVTRSFDVFFDMYLNKRLRKQSWGWWFETPFRPLQRHCNDVNLYN